MGKRKRSKTAPGNNVFDLEDAKKVFRQLKQKEQELLKKQNKLLRKIKQHQELLLAEYDIGLCRQAKQLEYLLMETTKLHDGVKNPFFD